MRLEDLPDNELEAIASGNLESLSDGALEMLANEGQSGNVPLSPMGQDTNYDVANRSTTANPGYVRADAIPLMQDPAMTGAPVYSGLTGQDKFSGLNVPNAFEEAARSAGPAIGSTLGGALAGPPGMVAGAAAGRSVQNLGQNIMSTVDPNVQPKGMGRLIAEPVADAAFQKGAEYVAPAIKWAGAQASEYGGRAFDYAAKNLGGMGQSTVNALKENAPAVYAKLGITREEVGALGGKVRDTIGKSVQAAEDFYSKTVARYSGQKSSGFEAKRLNFKDAVLPRIDEIASAEGYATPSKVNIADAYGADMVSPDGVKRVTDAGQAAEFQKFRDLANNLYQATPQQVYFFQRDLNAAIRNAQGSPLSSALGKVKGAVNEFIESQADSFPDLVKANRGYAAAKTLEEDTARLSSADDMVAYVKNAFSPNKYESQKREAIEALAQSNPELGRLIDSMMTGVAAEEASPLFRSLPQTGFGAAIGKVNAVAGGAIGATGAFSPIAAAAAVPLWAAANTAFSPRAYATGYRYGPGLASQASKAAQFAAAQAPKVAPYAAQSLEDLYRRMGVQP